MRSSWAREGPCSLEVGISTLSPVRHGGKVEEAEGGERQVCDISVVREGPVGAEGVIRG